MPLAEDHEVIEALAAYRLHEPFRVRGAVRTVCQNRHTCHTAGLEERPPRLHEQPGLGRGSGEWRCAGSRPRGRDEDHVANGSEKPQRLNGEEVASVERLLVAPEKPLPGSLSVALWGRLDPVLREDVRDRRAPTQSSVCVERHRFWCNPSGGFQQQYGEQALGSGSPSAASQVFGPGCCHTFGRRASGTRPGSWMAAQSDSTPRTRRA